MTYNNENLLDDVGWRILEELQDDARLSFSELGRRVNLSQPAVTERVRRLEEAGIISGYHARIDPIRIGRSIAAFIRLETAMSRSKVAQVEALVKDLPEVVECHRVTGDDCFVLRAHVATIEHLEKVVNRLAAYGRSSTSIVLSSVLTRRTFTNSVVE